MTTHPQIEIDKAFSEKLVIHENLAEEVVVTTVNKITICLMRNRDLLAAKKEWLTPLGLFLALLTTLVAAEFRKFIFEPNVWTAIYVIGTMISFIWLCISGYKAWENRFKGSIDAIIGELKNQTAQQSAQTETHK